MPEVPDALYPWMHLVGRILFSFIFILNGVMHFAKTDQYAGYAQSRGVPAPKAWVYTTGVMILVGGVFVLLGWHRFIGAGLLVIFLLLSAFWVHNFWKDTDPGVKMSEMVHFQKDLALCGAALLLAHYARWSWPMSLGG